MSNIIGERITELLEKKGMKQKELAERVGVTEVTISRYVTGERIPHPDIIIKMAEVLESTTDYLLGRSIINRYNPNDKPDNVTTIAAHRADNPLADLSPEARKSVEDYIEYVRNKYPKKDTTN